MKSTTDFFSEIEAYSLMNSKCRDEGLPALKRLFEIAHNDTGQAVKVRLFLLGLFNGESFPFDLTMLRGLDVDLKLDCFRVLALDCFATQKEVHQYYDEMPKTFKAWAIERKEYLDNKS